MLTCLRIHPTTAQIFLYWMLHQNVFHMFQHFIVLKLNSLVNLLIFLIQPSIAFIKNTLESSSLEKNFIKRREILEIFSTLSRLEAARVYAGETKR